MASRIANNGATRNLCLTNAIPQITAKKIRADLDHIHNLVIVDLWSSGDALYVSLNSVAAAVSAKQCLQSRAEYKGPLKIRYIHDDCSDSLPEIAMARLKRPTGNPFTKKPSNVSLNRFQALSVTSDGSVESDGSEFTVTTGGVHLG